MLARLCACALLILPLPCQAQSSNSLVSANLKTKGPDADVDMMTVEPLTSGPTAATSAVCLTIQLAGEEITISQSNGRAVAKFLSAATDLDFPVLETPLGAEFSQLFLAEFVLTGLPDLLEKAARQLDSDGHQRLNRWIVKLTGGESAPAQVHFPNGGRAAASIRLHPSGRRKLESLETKETK